MKESSVNPDGRQGVKTSSQCRRRRYRDLFADGHLTKSVDTLVLQVTAHACAGLGSKESVVWKLVNSLVWPLVCWNHYKRVTQKGRKPADADSVLLSSSDTAPSGSMDDAEKTPGWDLRSLNHFKNSMRRTAQNIFEVISDDNREQSYCKYWLDSLLCRAFQDTQRPVREDWMVKPLFTGWIKRLLDRLLVRGRHKAKSGETLTRPGAIDLGLFYSLQKGSKKAWPALGEAKEKAALAKHKQRLSESHGLLPEDLRKAIEIASQQVFRGIADMEPTKFMPTSSACLQASRKHGGALGLTKRYNMDLDKKEGTEVKGKSDLDRMGRLPYLSATLDQWRSSEYAAMHKHCVDTITAGGEGLRNILGVKVMAIPEPGKFRIVTLGDGYLYSALQPLQGLMLKCWKRHNASTMLRDDLTERVREIGRDCVSLPMWCSVDYEAATDLLKRDATFTAFMAMVKTKHFSFVSVDKVPGMDLGLFSLFAGFASYPDGSSCDAIEGQLMGHPLSFPLLCVINLAVYRCAIERWVAEDSWERKEIGELMWENVLVNGDDMLFKCHNSFYEVFVETAKAAGFKISQGKQYLSPDSCMINSQIFSGRSDDMRRRGYLNLKLLTGISLKGGESEATPTQLGRDLNKMIELCPWAWPTVPFAFRRWEKDSWLGKFYKPNWYLPVHLGGFGVDRKYAPSGWKITRGQRLMAARFVHDPRMALYRKEGVNLPVASIAGAIANWRMIPGDYVPAAGESVVNDDAWLARLALASRAHSGPSNVTDAAMAARFRPEYRLKPMSREALERYWNAQVFAFGLPKCPPLRPLRVTSLEGLGFVKPRAVKARAWFKYRRALAAEKAERDLEKLRDDEFSDFDSDLDGPDQIEDAIELPDL